MDGVKDKPENGPMKDEKDAANETRALLKPLHWIGKHLNFFRIHLITFIVLPLIFSAIFWSIDTHPRGHKYVDCLALCVSAMTVTGLNPLLMEELNARQHALCFILSTIGSVSGVALISILVRQYFFLTHFRDRIEADRKARMSAFGEEGGYGKRRLSIRRIGQAVRVDNSGKEDHHQLEGTRSNSLSLEEATQDSGNAATPPTAETATNNVQMSRTRTQGRTTQITVAPMPRTEMMQTRRRIIASQGVPLHPTLTRNPDNKAMVSGLGGFESPFSLLNKLIKRWWHRAQPNEPLPRTKTFRSTKTGQWPTEDDGDPSTANANYITFDATVGRNSRFLGLTSEQRDELGGVEYRALSLLAKIVTAYILLFQLIPMAIFCPLFSSARYAYQFENAGTVTGQGAFYAAFNANSAFANAGLSLLDTSLLTFQGTYGWTLTNGLLILAGNAAFPVFLRGIIWTMSKCVRKNSRMHESLTFLLDHPRRTFFYLFPSYQTWFLVFTLFLISGVQWALFPLLNTGLVDFESLSGSERVVCGLVQAIATRSAGYNLVPLSSLAPSYQLVLVVVMYISVYPIALSLRASNVYEEQSLGIYRTEEDEDEFEEAHNRLRKPGAYFLEHAKRQLAFDGPWLVFAIWLIAIVERTIILDAATDTWMNLWTVMFEVISAYGTVGLSLGLPYSATSLCAAFSPLAKVLLCMVMIRGRHRGLPVAIDRSILLPSDIASLNARTLDSEDDRDEGLYIQPEDSRFT